MADVTLTATVDESHILHLELPPEIIGEVEVVVRPRATVGNGPAILEAIRRSPKIDDPAFFQRAREELRAMREED